MDPALFDANTLARWLLTVVTAMIGIGPIIADFNRTHATNPLWPPHARFHVVWQVLGNSSVCALGLYLLWAASPDYVNHLRVAAGLCFIWGISFFVTLASMQLFEGALRDVNGIEPFRFPVLGKVYEVDTNLFGATLLMTVTAIAFANIQG